MFRKLAELLGALMGKRFVVRLSDAELERAVRLSENRGVPPRVRLRAAILAASHEGLGDEHIAARLETSVATVQRTRKRYSTSGLDAAIGWSGAVPSPALVEPGAVPGWVAAVLTRCLTIEGALGGALVDYKSGACLGKSGGNGLDMDAAAAGNAEVVRAKIKTLTDLKLTDSIEDVLITLSTQYHLIRLVSSRRSLFLYFILDRRTSNLALARHQLSEIEIDIALAT